MDFGWRRPSYLAVLAAITAATVYLAGCRARPAEQVEVLGVSDVVVDTPRVGEVVSSPLEVKGKARGFWYFEAAIPVALKDQAGNVLVRQHLQAKSDWMTEDHVPFEGTLEFTPPSAEVGVLVIEKNNPSGLPGRDASFEVPVRFR